MRKRINPVVAVVVVIVALVGISLLASAVTNNVTGHEAQTIIKPSKPDDPKFHPAPKLNLSDSGT